MEYLNISLEDDNTENISEFSSQPLIFLALKALNESADHLCNSTNTSEFPCNESFYDYGKHDYSEGLAIEKILSIVVPLIFGLIVIIGLFGNSLVVLVVLCNPQMRSTTNLLILNLAVADLLFIVFCVPFTAWDYTFPNWMFGDAWCRVVQYFVIVCAYASIYTLVLMSLDRFLAVVHPITSMSLRTERNAYIAILIMWLVILLSCIPAIGAYGEFSYTFRDRENSVCGFLTSEGYNQYVFQICFFLSSYLVPLLLTFGLYLLMLKRLWFHGAPGGHMSAESVRSKKRVTRMVVVVVCIFATCWGPIQVVLFLKSLNFYTIGPETLVIQIAAQIFAYMNSCVNPILYAFLSENFRKAFFKVVACRHGYDRRTRLPDLDTRAERETVGTCLTKANKMNNDIC